MTILYGEDRISERGRRYRLRSFRIAMLGDEGVLAPDNVFVCEEPDPAQAMTEMQMALADTPYNAAVWLGPCKTVSEDLKNRLTTYWAEVCGDQSTRFSVCFNERDSQYESDIRSAFANPLSVDASGIKPPREWVDYTCDVFDGFRAALGEFEGKAVSGWESYLSSTEVRNTADHGVELDPHYDPVREKYSGVQSCRMLWSQNGPGTLLIADNDIRDFSEYRHETLESLGLPSSIRVKDGFEGNLLCEKKYPFLFKNPETTLYGAPPWAVVLLHAGHFEPPKKRCAHASPIANEERKRLDRLLWIGSLKLEGNV